MGKTCYRVIEEAWANRHEDRSARRAPSESGLYAAITAGALPLQLAVSWCLPAGSCAAFAPLTGYSAKLILDHLPSRFSPHPGRPGLTLVTLS